MNDRYTSSAEIYDLIYAGIVDYPATGRQLKWLIEQRNPKARSVLEVGCGTGAVLAQLVDRFEVVGLDMSEAMLEVAATKLPSVELHRADMADFDLGRAFDAVVCMFSSIGYMTDLASLHAAYERMAAHLEIGGVLIVEPWFEPDAFVPGHVGASAAGGPSLRVHRVNTSWLEDEGRVSVMDMHHLVGRPEGVHHFVERHRMGLFTVAEHMAALDAAGIDAEHRPDLFMGRGTYIGVKA